MIKLQATGVVLNPRCVQPRDSKYPPRTYFDLQTSEHGKLSFSIQHDRTAELLPLSQSLRAVVMTAQLKANEWQGNQKLEVVGGLQFNAIPSDEEKEKEKQKQPA